MLLIIAKGVITNGGYCVTTVQGIVAARPEKCFGLQKDTSTAGVTQQVR